MEPWYIATGKFDPSSGEVWTKYIAWSGLSQLRELVSLDPILCPTVLPEIKDSYWPYIVNESFMLDYFHDLDFLMSEISEARKSNVLCVYRNPPLFNSVPRGSEGFEFLGYDLVDIQGSASALSNCGGFQDVFMNSELSPHGLLTDHSRAVAVKDRLSELHPDEPHANCHFWAIFRLAE